MSGTNDREAIRQWLEEQFSVVVEGTGPGTGAVQIVGMLHHAHSGDVPLHSMTARQAGNWGKAEPMAEVFDSISVRHARGITGGSSAQQFSLNVCREGGKPTAVLPFTRASAPSVTGGANGFGLASEPPNATGAQGQAMRLLEILAQGSFAQVQHVTSTQAQLIDKLSARLSSVEQTSDQRWLALQSLLKDWMQTSASMQLRALGVEAGRRLLPLLPAALSTLTGSERLVPEREVENSLFDTLLESQTPEQLNDLLGTVSASPGGGALSAILADHLVRAQKRKAQRAREHQELMSGVPERSFEQGEADAAGRAIRALAPEPTNGHGHTNGHANGHSRAETPKAQGPSGAMDGDAMLDVMLATLTDGEIDQVALMFASKRPDVPGLAGEIKSRYAAVKGKAT